ncbi:MAG TPA: thymidylate synthase (FAD) [Elusimicrobia bacterium]|nr:MAG: hypothetical protein A2278_00320 [Elusimicrobia bacterium RIFOXYA12_FULL_49_49]OGS09815.1 MAG: hypothetical protein A2204_04750 [Elusimicrobia bacterium RIFOXYA1_FULL_47_7]OGS10840.1 MAG: hypothetical protein A2386_03390 [Elusimicrobia bacterium RIFOXYB1_FULL_48_9]OGS15106.1 MAG: hypothetical protein A2251_00330 [Elusimicrobia bacterium RIFOXYA2_FULL_47_53]OGS29726.1 MAG: hypothetical protein A2323_01130 [Elusimicrobia bacterium RIFOXYB2_FULL_46_23]HBU70203.1 thymidylate synthase (FAD)
MKVELAGFNVDTSVLKELEVKCGKREDITPEVLSAAYARISRDPRNITEIRQFARTEVERSRKSNSTIIFKMGHHSVAEHAVFNMDIIGLSRFAMEELEKFRLCSYTEKSQRYITLDKDFVTPAEIRNTPLENLFTETIKLQNSAYFEFYEKLKTHVFRKNSGLAADEKNHNLLEGWAKEDARYITSLATESQVGLTMNARNAELMLRRFASSALPEINELGAKIYEQISVVAPSIVIFHQANDKDQKTYPELHKLLSGYSSEKQKSEKDVALVDYSKNGDLIVAAALMHASTNLPFEDCLSQVKKMPKAKLGYIYKTSWKNHQLYDSMLREYEFVNLTYNIILSSACFGQLKRHRMSTITAQNYDPALGITMPESIEEIGEEKRFKEVVSRSEDAYFKILKKFPLAAPYILNNCHRKRVLMRVNAREMYSISRLREDAHAQWDIRNVSGAMAALAKKAMPRVFGLIGGKDQYGKIYSSVFGRPPKVVAAELPGARKISS